MTNSKIATVLIFGKRNRKGKELEGIMAEPFFNVILVSRLTDLFTLLLTDRYEVIVVPDTFEDRLDKDFFVAPYASAPTCNRTSPAGNK
jgi:hypothetical protein